MALHYASSVPSLVYLSRWRRLGAYLIEGLIWIAGGGVLSTITFGLMTPLVIIGQLAYAAFFIWYFGGVIGHLVVGGRVVNHRNGAPLTLGQSAGRAIAFLMDFLILPMLINWVMVLARPDRRHLYDLMVGTVVVQDDRLNEERWTRIAP